MSNSARYGSSPTAAASAASAAAAAASSSRTVTITPAYAIENFHLFKVQPAHINKFSHKRESTILFDGKEPIFQIGQDHVYTPLGEVEREGDLVQCPFALSRWDSSKGKFETVPSSDCVDWAIVEAQTEKRKNPSGKLHLSLNLYQHDVPGTQGNLTYRLFKMLYELIVDALVNGTPVGPRGADGNPTRVKIMDLSLPVEAIRHMLGSPIREDTKGEYSPILKSKIRYVVEGGRLKVKAQIFDMQNPVRDPNTGYPVIDPVTRTFKYAPVDDAFTVITKRCRGMWLVKPNPILFNKGEINFTTDTIRARVEQPTTFFESVEWAATGAPMIVDSGAQQEPDDEYGGGGDFISQQQQQSFKAPLGATPGHFMYPASASAGGGGSGGGGGGAMPMSYQ